MTDKEILQKAVEKASDNGYNIPLFLLRTEIHDEWAKYGNHYYAIIFSHNFAKAFFPQNFEFSVPEKCTWMIPKGFDIGLFVGVEGVDSYPTPYKVSRALSCIYFMEKCKGKKAIVTPPIDSWIIHLQQMVIHPEPLKYLEQFLMI